MDYDPSETARTEKRERESREMTMFGLTIEEMRSDFDEIVGEEGADAKGEAGRIVIGILADGQEMLNLRLIDQARQRINRAKWVIEEYVIRGRAVKPLLTIVEDEEDRG